MLRNELFESVIREAREAHSFQLFESVLREADNSSEELEQIRDRIEKKLVDMAVKIEFVSFNIENYNELLGNGVNTPCGFVEFGENQFLKFKGRDNGGRQNLIWATRKTLEDPIVVIHNDAPDETKHES